MATTDLSRHATDFRKHYAGVRMQQGRVLTDDDFNEHARLEAEDLRRTRIDTIGPVGSPDDGFLITNPVIDTTTNRPTFTITAGTFYLGGQRLTLEADEYYQLQKDWLQNGASTDDPILTVPTGTRYDLAWLETWQQAVSAVEDSELFEVALRGPDTSTRVRHVRRVHVLPDVGTADCNSAWQVLLKSLAGLGTLNDEFELVPDAKLKVEPDGSGGSSNLCSPPVTGGYLGAENQAIRVQLVSPGTFTWGFDNAAPLYRVQLGADANGDRRRITMLTLPKDTAHWPLAGQVVELLPWSAVLPNGQKLAELHGCLAKVSASYDPDQKYFEIDTTPPDDASGQLFGETWKDRTGTNGDASSLDDEGEFFYLRVWNRGSDTSSAAAIAFSAGTGVSLGNTGLKVTFSGTQLRPDDFWIIAARPDSPNVVVPWELSTARRPHGVRRWIAPLAVVSWPGGTGDGTVENDCRETFLPLTRIRSCCTVTVGDGNESHGNFTSIQDAIDSLPEKGGRVCVLPGRYQETIKILNRHDIVISGCGPRTVIVGVDSGSENTAAAAAISIVGGYNFGLEDFAVEAAETGIGIDLVGLNRYSDIEQEAESELINVTVSNVVVSAIQRCALRARFVRDLTVTGCEFSNEDRSTSEPTVRLLGDDVRFERNLVQVASREWMPMMMSSEAGSSGEFAPGTAAQGGVQIEGMSERVLVRDNLIRGGSNHGIILGSIRERNGSSGEGPDNNNDGGWGPSDPCQWKIAFSLWEKKPTESKGREISAGPLLEIRIVDNRIHDHGGCGIGVIQFWNLKNTDEFIEVLGLTIEQNDIRRCLQRSIEEPTAALAAMMGYGGIALASVEHLVVRDNTIAENGSDLADPVCGIFVLHGEGVEISRNRILDNGSPPEESADSTASGSAGSSSTGSLKRGYRGGIAIVYALAPSRLTAIDQFGQASTTAPLQSGEPAAKIHENIVTAPIGQALSLVALGPVSIQGNQFTTRGVAKKGPSEGFTAAAVRIVNLGMSNEILLQQLAFGFFGQQQALDPLGSFNTARLDDLMLGRVLANGQVLFSDNQVNLDLLGVGTDFSLSSVLIATLDDVGFHDNQCEANLYLLDDIVLSHALIFGFTTRVTGNRFKEGYLSAFLSALTLAFFANTTSLNQGTHCITALCFKPAKLFHVGNTTLIGPNPLLTMFAKNLTCDELAKWLQSALEGKSSLAQGFGSQTADPGDPASPVLNEFGQPVSV
jgi:hypothetical protein